MQIDGRFADAELHALIDASAVEMAPIRRQRQIRSALLRHQTQLYHLTLYRQKLAWAMRAGVHAQPAANNHMRAWLVKLAP